MFLTHDPIFFAQLPKYCPGAGLNSENDGSPTLRFGESLDFALSFRPRDLFAWPTAL
jgi:hypothetical protein